MALGDHRLPLLRAVAGYSPVLTTPRFPLLPCVAVIAPSIPYARERDHGHRAERPLFRYYRAFARLSGPIQASQRALRTV